MVRRVRLRTFYVYEHWRPDKGLPFYVGKGYGKRILVNQPRSKWHKAIVKHLAKKGLSVEVRKVFTYLDEPTALALERSQIAYWRSHGIKLVNLTDGGDGTSGIVWTPEQCENSRVAAEKRWADPVYRANYFAAHKAALADPTKSKGTWSEARRASTSKRAKDYWSNPENRKQQSETLRAMSDVISARTKEGMADPAVRKQLSESLKAYAQTPAGRAHVEKLVAAESSEARSARLTAAALDPNSAFSKGRDSAATIAKRSATLKELYKSEELRDSIAKAVSASRESPEERARMSEAAKLAYSRPEVKARHSAAVKAAWARRKARLASAKQRK